MTNLTFTSNIFSTDSSHNRRVEIRRLSYIMLFRVILFTLVLGGTVFMNIALGKPEELEGPAVSFLFSFIIFIYALNILYTVVLRKIKRLYHFSAFQIGVDLITSAVLIYYTGGSESAFILFLMLAPIAAAVALDRTAAIITAVVGIFLFITVSLLLFDHLIPPLPGQIILPPEMTTKTVARSLLINCSAITAVTVLGGYLAGQLRMITAKIDQQQAYIDDLATLNADIIRSLSSGLITIDAEGQILTMNQAASEILGIKTEDALGCRLTDLIPALGQLIASEGDLRRVEVSLTKKNATIILGVSVSPLVDHTNQMRGRIINFQNLTSVKTLEEQIKRSEHLASLGRISAGIAHEIRNPLASISGSLELLRREEQSDPDKRKLMDIALREIERLNELITSFLAYARPKPPNLVPVDLGQDIHDLTESIGKLLFVPDCPQIKITESKKDLWINADRDQLQSVLWNLIHNAWEAGEHENIEIRVGAPSPQWVSLEVEDRAAGIPPDQLKRVFEPFFTTKAQGTGLGLATVHQIVQQHKGTINVTSKERQGTIFTLTFPRIERASFAGDADCR